jgi:hypothetical protein
MVSPAILVTNPHRAAGYKVYIKTDTFLPNDNIYKWKYIHLNKKIALFLIDPLSPYLNQALLCSRAKSLNMTELIRVCIIILYTTYRFSQLDRENDTTT